MNKRTVHIAWDGDRLDKVRAIKAIRHVTWTSLLEAKHTLEESASGTIITLSDKCEYADAVSRLRDARILVRDTTVAQYAPAIKEIATLAALKGDTWVANALLRIIGEQHD